MEEKNTLLCCLFEHVAFLSLHTLIVQSNGQNVITCRTGARMCSGIMCARLFTGTPRRCRED
jgi:hypothetical protein